MINTKSAKGISAKDWAKKVFYNDTVTKSLLKGLPAEKLAEQQARIQAAMEDPFTLKKLTDAAGNEMAYSGLGTTAQSALDIMKRHKLATAATAGLGAANIAGLFDNPQIAGQLVGSLIGGAGGYGISKLLGAPLSGYGITNAALIGGGLGSLFDKLVNKAQKKSEESEKQFYDALKYRDTYR